MTQTTEAQISRQMNHCYKVMPMLIRDRSKGAHQLLQLKYGMLNILSSPKMMYYF